MLSSGAYCQPYIADFYAGTDLFSLIRICTNLLGQSQFVHIVSWFFFVLDVLYNPFDNKTNQQKDVGENTFSKLQMFL